MTTYQQLREAGACDARTLVRMDCRGDRVTIDRSEPERPRSSQSDPLKAPRRG
jgi:hypothetical protein